MSDKTKGNCKVFLGTLKRECIPCPRELGCSPGEEIAKQTLKDVPGNSKDKP